MRWWERVWFIIGGLLLIDPGTVTDLIGIAMLAMGVLYQWRKSQSLKKTGLLGEQQT